MVGFHILGNAASETLSSRTDPCACMERGFVTDLLPARCKRRRAGKGYLFTFCDYRQWRIISEIFFWYEARLLSTSFAVAMNPAVIAPPAAGAAPSAEVLAGAAAVVQRERTTGGQRESERSCQIKEHAITSLSPQTVPAGLTVVFAFLAGLQCLPHCCH